MAIESFLPPIPGPQWERLWHYLQVRDGGAPTKEPEPEALTQTPLSDHTIDTITWAFSEASGEDARRSDGFVVFYELDDGGDGTDEPVAHQQLLAITSRSAQFCWPDDCIRSYRVAAFRWTYGGMVIGPPRSLAVWVGVVS